MTSCPASIHFLVVLVSLPSVSLDPCHLNLVERRYSRAAWLIKALPQTVPHHGILGLKLSVFDALINVLYQWTLLVSVFSSRHCHILSDSWPIRVVTDLIMNVSCDWLRLLNLHLSHTNERGWLLGRLTLTCYAFLTACHSLMLC